MNNEQLKTILTDDAWEILSSYVKTMENKLNRYEIKEKDQIIILNGINEFIQDYYDSQHKIEKINFQKILKLIEEIGSPLEIIQILEVNEQPDNKNTSNKDSNFQIVLCITCNWKNAFSDHYCQNCGKDLKVRREPTLKEIAIQKIFDNPYSASFVIIITTFIAIGSGWDFLFDQNIYTYPHPIFVFAINFFKMFIPGAIFSLIIGWIMDEIFEEKKSFKYKYSKALESFEDSFAVGWLGLFLGFIFTLSFIFVSWLFLLPQTLTILTILGVEVIIIIIIFILSLVWVGINETRKPSNIAYIHLLNAKKIVNQKNVKKLAKWNLNIGLPLYMLYTVVVLLLFNIIVAELNISGEVQLIFIIVSLIILILTLNGIFTMRLYSWYYIIDIIQETKQ